MAEYLIQDSTLEDIADAIRAKTGNSELINPEDMPDEIAGIQTGVPSEPEELDVCFYDYEGTRLYSYTASDFLALTEMPQNPDRSNDEIPLTSQGWNWNLNEAQEYVEEYGELVIGQTYVPTDGKTHVLFEIPEGSSSVKRKMVLYFGQSEEDGVTVDWGDSSTPEVIHDTESKTHTHEYANTGNYHLTIAVTNGAVSFEDTQNGHGMFGDLHSAQSNDELFAKNYVKKVFFGNNISSTNGALLDSCHNITEVTLPIGITKTYNGGFRLNMHLKCMIFPRGFTEIAYEQCNKNYNLKVVSFPNTITSFNGIAFGSSSIRKITIPSSVIQMTGSSIFGGSKQLVSAIVPSSVTAFGSLVFGTCENLKKLVYMASFNNINFSGLYSLKDLTLSDSVTTITYLSQCYAMTKVAIPASVTLVKTKSFRYNQNMEEYHFEATTPPTLENVDAFDCMSSYCKIYVPYSEDHSVLEAYKTATNWSTYADKIVEEPTP